MKAIIEGKRYDTDTAEELAGWSNTNDYGDFRHEGFVVYRTKGGRYFIEFWGGPLSRYGRVFGNDRHGDKGLSALSNEAARTHLERCGDKGTAALERYFDVEDA